MQGNMKIITVERFTMRLSYVNNSIILCPEKVVKSVLAVIAQQEILYNLMGSCCFWKLLGFLPVKYFKILNILYSSKKKVDLSEPSISRPRPRLLKQDYKTKTTRPRPKTARPIYYLTKTKLSFWENNGKKYD